MNEPGELLARGRAADVFDRGDGTVLRRYRTDHDATAEGELMTHLRSAGYPVPAVHDADGRDLVMDLVPGPTMLDDIDRAPWRMWAHIATLADLQHRLATIDAPSWLASDERLPAGSSIVHLDLHPMNVIAGPDGPVVIDWTNARRAHADADAAMTVILAASFEPSSRKEWVGVRLMLGRFVQARGAVAVDRWWTEMVDYRRADPNLSPSERDKLMSIRQRRPGA